VYEVWRETRRALIVDVLLQNILVDFSRGIGGIGMFVRDESSSLEYWRSSMGWQATQAYPGELETG
jgi:hypothetical protein